MHHTSFAELPVGTAPQPVPVPHFPDVLHTVIWRNWDVVPVETLSRVLKAPMEDLLETAGSMGLPAPRPIAAAELRRNYMTVLHRNWHLLPYEQICGLLGWSPDRMQFGLNDDDFMWAKLGGYKPRCLPVHYEKPGAAARQRAEEITRILAEEGVPAPAAGAEPPFGFIDRFSSASGSAVRGGNEQISLRMVYPYFLRYGDPLMGEGVEDIPEGYLAALAACGVNAIWLQAILYTLAPWDLAPGLAEGWEERLENLRLLVERCRRHGIDVVLYMNEPRAMPRTFFEQHPGLRGVEEMPTRQAYGPDVVALCVSTEPVRKFLTDSVRHVFEQVPGLGGVLALTYSENLTNCYSRTYRERAADGTGLRTAFDATSHNPRNDAAEPCPRCLERGPLAVNADVCSLIERGMREAGSQGRFLLYLWSTPREWIPGILARLPAGTWVLCVSEWGTPFIRGDYSGEVNEYSISVVGPSAQSLVQWELARENGLKTVAKMQAANTYEFSSLPYIPALRLVARHLANLCAADVNGLMLGWTAGGSPSPNLELVRAFVENPGIGVNDALRVVAERRFGKNAAASVVAAWHQLSDAYEEFPFDISVCYAGPQSLGPANLLYARSTGFRATMVTFPFDDLDSWRGPYSAATLQDQFEKTARLWKQGAALLADAKSAFPSPALDDEWRIAEAAHLHFRSTANQIRFIRIRESDPAGTAEILRDEIALARQLLELARQDSRIGFEATNHYGYTPMDLVEKILNCRHLLTELAGSGIPSEPRRTAHDFLRR